MIKKCFLILVAWPLLFFSGVYAQDQSVADSLAKIYARGNLSGTAKLILLIDLSFNEVKDLKKALQYADELIIEAQNIGSNKYLRSGYFQKGIKLRLLGRIDQALEAFIKSAELAKKSSSLLGEGDSYGAMADTYSVVNNHLNAKKYYDLAITTLRQTNDTISLASALFNAGDEYNKTKSYDTALTYFKESQHLFETVNHLSGKAYSLGGLGMVFAALGKMNMAENNLSQAIVLLEDQGDYYPVCDYLLALSDVHLSKNDTRTAITDAERSLRLAEDHGLQEQIKNASLKLSQMFENEGNHEAALKYYKKHIVYSDSIKNISTVEKMANLRTDFEVSQKQLEVDLLNQQKRSNRNLSISLTIILALAIIILGILWRNNLHRQKAYKTLNLQKLETDAQKVKVENALIELQITQKQLIQAAKMASLGELTAGIAHEIQNPLNFVNNFSEVSVELLDELKADTINKAQSPDIDRSGEIMKILTENLKKISQHGKRADSIVKGMLQHSKRSSTTREVTDINALAHEYLRLSYHGIRAKDNSFNADYTTHFDESAGTLELVTQDIGRVLLNLYNNAFYAVYARKKVEGNAFQPLVTVTTMRTADKVEIAVKDNGDGISPILHDKIFQPFFTTKPTGQGTGLGLSLSYEIIKAHGGDIKFHTQEGEYTEFVVRLPVGNKA